MRQRRTSSNALALKTGMALLSKQLEQLDTKVQRIEAPGKPSSEGGIDFIAQLDGMAFTVRSVSMEAGRSQDFFVVGYDKDQNPRKFDGVPKLRVENPEIVSVVYKKIKGEHACTVTALDNGKADENGFLGLGVVIADGDGKPGEGERPISGRLEIPITSRGADAIGFRPVGEEYDAEVPSEGEEPAPLEPDPEAPPAPVDGESKES